MRRIAPKLFGARGWHQEHAAGIDVVRSEETGTAEIRKNT
jgi:hypothetical protein